VVREADAAAAASADEVDGGNASLLQVLRCLLLPCLMLLTRLRNSVMKAAAHLFAAQVEERSGRHSMLWVGFYILHVAMSFMFHCLQPPDECTAMCLKCCHVGLAGGGGGVERAGHGGDAGGAAAASRAGAAAGAAVAAPTAWLRQRRTRHLRVR